MNNGILLYAQTTKAGNLHPVFFELATKARELSQKLNNAPIMAMIITSIGQTQKYKADFEKAGIDKVFAIEHEKLADYLTDLYAKSALEIIQKAEPTILLIGATTEGRDLAPRISTSLHTGLTADCTELDINEKQLLEATRPTFGGQLMATILSKKFPQMATVRPGVFKSEDFNSTKNTEIFYENINFEDVEERVKILNFTQKLQDETNNLQNAEIIIAGGKGMKSEKGFELLKDFANKINAQVGATRGAVEMGIAPREIQIGQTGLTVTPKIYIACALSGAIQHIVGMENSDKIFAINTDANAPIFENCDYGIVGDVFEVLPKIMETL